jgi:hypothetical protein
MTIKQRKRRHTRRRAHAAGVSRAIVPRGGHCVAKWTVWPTGAADTLAEHAAADHAAEREAELRLLTVAKLQALATRRGVEYRAKDRKADLIAKIMAAAS